jgi:DNA-binding NarL/FixJ family response regulator
MRRDCGTSSAKPAEPIARPRIMIHVLIADDHAVVRAGLKQILSSTADVQVAAEAASGNEALAAIRAQRFDVIVLDMSMPGRSGLDLIRQIKDEQPQARILVLSMHQEEQYAVRALKAGASGYLNKDSAPELLVGAIRKVAGGGAFISPNIAEQLAHGVIRNQNQPLHTLLSDREFEVFQRLVAGQSVSAIADKLNVSVKTISTHKSRIMQKMGMESATELIRYALENGLVEQRGD